MKTKIKLVSEKIDQWLNWSAMSKGIDNRFLRIAVGAIELVDGTIINLGLNFVDDKIPEEYRPMWEKFIDGVIAEDIECIIQTSSEVAASLIKIEVVKEEDQVKIIHALLGMIINLLPTIFQKKNAA